MNDLLDISHWITLRINGVDVTAYYVTLSLTITRTLGAELDTCRFSLYDYNGRLGAVAGWDEVLITESGYGATLFAGFVVSAAQESRSGGVLAWELTALDKGVLFQKIEVNAIYANLTSAAIISDLITTYAPWVDATTHVATGMTRSERFERKSLLDCLKVLAEADHYTWWLDDTVLWYMPETTALPAPFGLASAPEADYVTSYPLLAESLRVERDYMDVRNKVVVHGGMRASDPLTDVFTGDGVTTEFVTTMKPINVFIAIYLNQVSVRFGREYIDDPTRYDILTNWNHGIVRFATAPPAGAEIQVIYTYENPLRVTVTDLASALLYCPSVVNYFEYVHVDPALVTETAAENVALAVLAQYAYERVYGKVAIDRLGLLPGQIVAITDSTLGWSAAAYLIQSCQIEEVQPTIFRTTVSFGNRLPTFTDALLGLAGAAGGVAAGASGGQGDILNNPLDLRQPTGYQYIQIGSGEYILVPVFHQLIGNGLDFSDANNSAYLALF